MEAAAAEENPERFDPDAMAGGLMEAEHRARYWWAAGWVEGSRVLDAGCGMGYGTAMLAARGPASLAGVDLSESALAAARAELGDRADLTVADVRELPFEADTFDVIVCFEVIEHVERQDEALAELARVLAPDGVLLVSSPNRDIYTPGNPFHVHEYTPDEFAEALGSHFQHVALHRQHPWLASAVIGPETQMAAGPLPIVGAATNDPLEPGRETYTVAAASNAELTSQPDLVVLADDFEVRWWHEQLDRLQAEVNRGAVRAAQSDDEVRRLSRRLLEAEQVAARVRELEHQVELLEGDCAGLQIQIGYRDEVIRDIQSSISWRVTSPLRRAKALLDRRG